MFQKNSNKTLPDQVTEPKTSYYKTCDLFPDDSFLTFLEIWT